MSRYYVLDVPATRMVFVDASVAATQFIRLTDFGYAPVLVVRARLPPGVSSWEVVR